MGKRMPYLYQVGEVVNETLKIVELIRVPKDKKYTEKGYVVKSLIYADAPEYTISEGSLRKGQGCAYKRGLRVFDGNSLWSKVEYRKHIIDVEQAKNIAPNHSKPILFKCGSDICDTAKLMKPNTLIRNGFACPNCSKNISYPELFFLAVNQHFNLDFEYQVTYENGRFDFINYDTKTIVEMNGLAHYEEVTGNWGDAHLRTVESDNKKREWAKENGYNLIFIDARKSEFEFIKDNINACEYLPSIRVKDVKTIMEIIEVNEYYNIKEMVRLYKEDKLSTLKIGEIYKVSYNVIAKILKNNGVRIRNNSRVFKCITTGELFESQSQAAQSLGLHNCKISLCLSGKRKSTGGYIFRYATDIEEHVYYAAEERANQPVTLKIKLEEGYFKVD